MKENISPLVTAAEAVTLTREYGCIDTMETALNTAFAWADSSEGQSKERLNNVLNNAVYADLSFCAMLQAVYTAGRLQGIREERKKAAEKTLKAMR